ncbi:MAG: hypothetical protein IT431_02105 [Phycisphaerales bacterium]|nr:hypothetical protein [Phycisphaerales bacterium]
MQDAIDPQTTPDDGAQPLQGQPEGGATGGFVSREGLSVALIALGCVLMLIMIARMLGRRRWGRGAEAPVVKTPLAAAQASFTSTAAHDRLDRLMADAEELTRRLAAVLDNRAAKIEILIEQADDRLRALEAAGSDAGGPAGSREVRPASGMGEGSGQGQEPQASLATDPLHRKVYDLADQGLTPVDIARRIEKPTGQVELILALRRA